LTQPHGGNIYYYSKKYGIPEEKFLDFSASINPLGPPKSAMAALKSALPSLVNYPDPDSGLLKKALSERFNIDADSLLIGNGSTELVYLLPRAMRPARTLVLAPTFSDYERAARLAGGAVAYFPLKERDGFLPDMDRLRTALDGAGMFFLCNPNNPTGALLDRGRVLDVLKMARKRGATVIVDEAFMEYSPDGSVIGEAASTSGVAVIRNFTKFYGMPGLRLGYLVARPALVRRLESVKEPWSVNALAQASAVAALKDAEYEKKSLHVMEKERRYLFDKLSGISGLAPGPTAANFILIKLICPVLTSSELTEALASEGILVRDCTNFRGLGGSFIRVAIKTRRENDTLAAALQSFTTRMRCDKF
jgi:threonine-phosphate decarboxylase